MELNEITREIIGAAIEVHRALGPGLRFNEVAMRSGVQRVVNAYRGPPPTDSTGDS